MNRTAPIAFLMLLGCVQAGFSQDEQPVLLPSSRTISAVENSERNPFAKPEMPKIEAPEVETAGMSEESRIEAILESLKVVGRTRGPSGWKVLLGDLILEEGKLLPPVIEGQTNVLRVAHIHESMIEIEWVNKDARELPRRIFIIVNLKPTVGFALGGQKPSANSNALPTVITRPPEQPLGIDDPSPQR